jgi:hypothetical protein
MIFKRAVAGIAIIFLAVAFPLSAAQGAEALIEGLQIEQGNGTVMVGFSVKNCFNAKMEEAIKAGVPTTFNFFVTLYKTRPLIWDKKIASRKFRHRIIYDNLKQDFRIWLQEKEKEIRVADWEEAKRSMQLVEGFPVVKGQKLEKGDYELGVKAELDPVKLPLGLEGILFFVSLWNFETDWQYRTIRVEP